MLPGWSRLDVAGKPVDVFTPPEPNPLPFALLWLHDEDGVSPAIDPVLTGELRSRRLRCVAPWAGRSWWVDRVCPEFDPALTAERHLLDNVSPWLASAWGVGPRGVAVAGVGMGGQGAVRIGLKYPARFPVVASIRGAFDFHEQYGQGTPLDDMYPSRERARQDTAVLHVHPHDWPPHIWFACHPASAWYRGNDRLHEKLTAVGVPHSADLDAPADPTRLIGPLLTAAATALERESRRLA